VMKGGTSFRFASIHIRRITQRQPQSHGRYRYMKNLAVCAALLALSASAMASSETYSVIVAVTQGDLELEPHRSFVSDGEQLHYSRTSTINATQSVTIDEAGKSE